MNGPGRVLICGAGNLLLSDEGFGVHCLRYLEATYQFPEQIELLDAGTLGILITHRIEEASRVYLIDCIQVPGAIPGTMLRYTKNDLLLKGLPIKLSPHQIGLQEMLLLSETRGRCPENLFLLGAVPESLAPGVELTCTLRDCVLPLTKGLVEELRAQGFSIRRHC